MKTLQQIATEMYNNFELAERENGSKFYRTKKEIDWQRDIIFKAHLDRMPDDDIYTRIHDILSTWSDMDENSTEDDLRQAIYDQEPDIYTHDLTGWLHSDDRNVEYLTQSLEEYGHTDGFNALVTAQKLYIEEIANELLSGITEYLELVEEEA